MYKLLSNWKSERCNCELRYTAKTRKMEEELEMEKAKRLKIEQELRQEREASDNLKAKQDVRLQILSKWLIKGACQRSQISNTRKGYQYSKSHEYRLERQRKDNCNEALAFLRLLEITDRLNLFLRIADQLINQLIKELENQDNIAKLAQYSSIEREKYKHIQGFEEFIKELGISWSFYLDKDTN